MEKHLVLYYSKTGNSKFLAEKVATHLDCDIKRINPLLDFTMFLFFISKLNIGISTNISRSLIRQYDELIIVGPLWGGLINAPLKNVLKKCIDEGKVVHFAMSCDVPDHDKDHQYGYARALKTAEEMGASLVKTTIGFSNALVAEDMKSKGIQPPEKIRLTDKNFQGPIEGKLHQFVSHIKENQQNK
jgi:hypothetical protein